MKNDLSSACVSGEQTEQDQPHFGNCVFFMCAEKEEEAKEENMDVVMARGKRTTWHDCLAFRVLHFGSLSQPLLSCSHTHTHTHTHTPAYKDHCILATGIHTETD